MVTHNPLHGSGRADFPHPALASGDDAKPPQRIGMADMFGRQVMGYEPPHPIPEDTTSLAATRQRAVPEPADLEPEQMQRRVIHRHPIITKMAADNGSQPFTYLRNGIMHPSLELGLDLTQLRLQPLANRLPNHRKPAITSLLPADMREAEEVERFRLPLSTPTPVFSRERSKFQQSCLLGVQLQSEPTKSIDKFFPEPFSIQFALEPSHNIIRKPHDDHIAGGQLPTPRQGPQIKCVVKVDVRQQRRCYSPNAKGNFEFSREVSFTRRKEIG